MDNDAITQLLRELDAYARSKRITRTALAREIGIPYSTFRKWFFSGGKHRKPSFQHIAAARAFLDASKTIQDEDAALWQRILEWWQTQHRFRTIRQLADAVGWDESLDRCIQQKAPPPTLVVRKVAEVAGFLQTATRADLEEARNRVQRLRWALLLLESELRWFRDATAAARETFRKELDQQDVGYISSLLAMLGDEDRFQRWQSLTTNRFNSFGSRGGGG